MNPNQMGSVPGVPIRGTIQSVDIPRGIVRVSLPLTSSSITYPVKIPVAWMGPRGQISCGYPQKGTSIFVMMSQGGEWVFVSYDQPDSTNTYDNDGVRRIRNKLRDGNWITLVENGVSLILDKEDGVTQGGATSFTQASIKSEHLNSDIWSSRFEQEMHFTEAHREITGPILRDLKQNGARDVVGSALTGHSYNYTLTPIGLDPQTLPRVSLTQNRNPALTESRKMFYEFINSFGYTNDAEEESIYAGAKDPSKPLPFQRKKSRTDTMSLSLDQPNYLAEIIIGTVVDIYGNILDINRNILPNGIIDSLSFRKSTEDQNVAFTKLREQLRKSIAYHFEINARKAGLNLPDYSNLDDYARDRSRFFFDIDKEGQFKMNVPASSETGNISLLVRNENFSHIKGAVNNEDRGQFLNSVDNKDVQLEPHGKGAVTLVSTEDSLKAFAAPLSRLDGTVIKLGTGFHDISDILFLHKLEEPYSTSKGTGGYDASLINFITPITEVVSSEIIVSGPGANAGGRSGTLSLDGMLSLSIGANTVDRQSLWLDCAGGIVAAVGRDKYNRSVAAALDGDIVMQVGGPTISNDSRFTVDTEARDGVVDIRVWNSGSFHTIRIDSQGIKIHTPQRIDIVSEGDMRFKSVNSNIYFDAEGVYFYPSDKSTGRLVLRSTEGAAGRTI
jgi:hypothetical protein